MVAVARFDVRAGGFVPVSGDLVQVVMSQSNYAYGLDPTGGVWTTFQNAGWSAIPRDLSVPFKQIFGGMGVWALTTQGAIYESVGTPMNPVQGILRYISAALGTDPAGDNPAYGLNFTNDLFSYRRDFSVNRFRWLPVATPPGVKFKAISVGSDGETWAIGLDGTTYRKDPNANDPSVNNFSVAGPHLVDIQVGMERNIWALAPLPPNTIGGFFVRHYANGAWRSVDGDPTQLISLSVGPTSANSVWGVDQFGQIKHFDFRRSRFVTVPFLNIPVGKNRVPVGKVAAGRNDEAMVLFAEQDISAPPR
jgi:hypothetical protein